MKLSELFYNCVYNIDYEQVGDDVNYAFVDDDETLYIYFECSNQVKDWILNFMFKKKQYGLFKVHRGFLHAYSQVRSIILDKVYSKDYKEIIVVGYSHGGGLAQLCHQDIKYHFPNIKLSTYAFETPRCLKVAKKHRFYWDGLITTRVNNDLVSHLPPRLFGFNDLGTMLKLKGDISVIHNKLPNCLKAHYEIVVLKALQDFESFLD